MPAFCTPLVSTPRPRLPATGARRPAAAATARRPVRRAAPRMQARGADGAFADESGADAQNGAAEESAEESGKHAAVSLPPTHILTVVGDDAAALAASLERVTNAVDAAGGPLITGFHALSPGAAEASVHVPTTEVGQLLQGALDVETGSRVRGRRRGRVAKKDAVEPDAGADATRMGQGMALQPHKTARMAKRLAVFDLDGTLIAEEGIDELAAAAGPDVRDAVADVTERAMRGELDFRDALAERVALLRGLDAGAVTAVRERVTVRRGARDVVSALRRTGCVPVVVSGGFASIAQHVAEAVGIQHVVANELELDEAGEKLTGGLVGEIVDAEFKRDTLLDFAERVGASRDEILVVGDGANDLLMMEEAGLSVAFNAKPVVQERALCTLNGPSLAPILYVLGMSDANIESLSTIPI